MSARESTGDSGAESVGRHESEAPVGSPEDPSEIGTAGWKEIAKRVATEVRNDRVPIVAAALAFYAILAVFPALIAAVSIYGLMFNPEQFQEQMIELAAILPSETATLVRQQLSQIVEASPTALGWTAAVAILGGLWTASSGVQSLIQSVNIAYDEEESRSWFELRLAALAFAAGFIVLGLAAIVVIVVAPPLLSGFDLPGPAEWAITLGSLLVLAVILGAALALLYRFAPNRDEPEWNWVSRGAVVAIVLWIIASLLFSLYVTNFGTFGETYGSLAGFVVLLMWFFISGFVVMIGAEINSEMEHQTEADTTTGPDEPMGSRGARKADTRP